MPATITSLVTTGSPGQSFTLNGSGFGSSNPASQVFLFPDSTGQVVVCTTTSWSATVIQGTLPTGLVPGTSTFLFVQLVGEDVGRASSSFYVGTPVVTAASSHQVGEFVSLADPASLDTAGHRVPPTDVTGPIGYLSAIAVSPANAFTVQWATTPLDPGGALHTVDVLGSKLTSQGSLTLACQRAVGVEFYNVSHRLSF